MIGRNKHVDRGSLFSWGPELTVSVPRLLGHDLTPILKGVAAAFKERGRHVVTSQIAHPVVLDTCAYLAAQQGQAMTYVPVDEHGVVPPEAVRHALTDETILRSLMCLVHKLLHAPTVHWKRSSREGRARDDVQLVRHLFELDP